jgi:hypothetical protein
LEYDTDPDPKDGKASPGQGSVHLSIQIPAHNQKIKTKLVKKKKRQEMTLSKEMGNTCTFFVKSTLFRSSGLSVTSK